MSVRDIAMEGYVFLLDWWWCCLKCFRCHLLLGGIVFECYRQSWLSWGDRKDYVAAKRALSYHALFRKVRAYGMIDLRNVEGVWNFMCTLIEQFLDRILELWEARFHLLGLRGVDQFCCYWVPEGSWFGSHWPLQKVSLFIDCFWLKLGWLTLIFLSVKTLEES